MKNKSDNVVLRININPKLVECILKDNGHNNLKGKVKGDIEVECDYIELASNIKDNEYGDTLNAIDSFIAKKVSSVLYDSEKPTKKVISSFIQVEVSDDDEIDTIAQEIAKYIKASL